MAALLDPPADISLLNALRASSCTGKFGAKKLKITILSYSLYDRGPGRFAGTLAATRPYSTTFALTRFPANRTLAPSPPQCHPSSTDPSSRVREPDPK